MNSFKIARNQLLLKVSSVIFEFYLAEIKLSRCCKQTALSISIQYTLCRKRITNDPSGYLLDLPIKAFSRNSRSHDSYMMVHT